MPIRKSLLSCITAGILIILELTAYPQDAGTYSNTDQRMTGPETVEFAGITDISTYINDSFSTQAEKVRAIYLWIATHIDYDLPSMYHPQKFNTPLECAENAFLTRKAVCQGYAELFNVLCRQCRLKSYIVEGYTKQNGQIVDLPHAWNAALIDGSWQVFDPTWGAGHINNGTYRKQLNNDFFMVPPKLIIKTHFPFDPLWQFSDSLVSPGTFRDGDHGDGEALPAFQYRDSLEAFDRQTTIERLAASIRRMEKQGTENKLIAERLAFLKYQLEVYRNNEVVLQYNKASVTYNEAVLILNTYVKYFNHQFLPGRPDAELQVMLDPAVQKLAEAKELTEGLISTQASLNNNINILRKNIGIAQVNTQKGKDFISTYLSKPEKSRKLLFRSGKK